MRIVSQILAGVCLLMVSTTTFADVEPFRRKAFNEAKAENKTILLDFHADWCPTCRKQGKILDGLSDDPRYDDVAFFEVNYDQNSRLKKEYAIRKQSTLVVLKGDREVARATGVTSTKGIKNLINKGFTTQSVSPYSANAVAAALEDGKRVVLDFHASWCGTCKKQGKVISGFLGDDEFSNVAFFRVDYDDAKLLRKLFQVTKQSTLIVLDGDKEVGRKTGVTKATDIRKLILGS